MRLKPHQESWNHPARSRAWTAAGQQGRDQLWVLTAWSSSQHPLLPRVCAGWLLTEESEGRVSDKHNYGLLDALWEKHGGIHAQGGLQLALHGCCTFSLCPSPTSAPFPRATAHSCWCVHKELNWSFPCLEKKLRGCTKFPFCNRNVGVPLGRTPQWRVGKRGNIIRKDYLRVFLQENQKYFNFKALCTKFGFLWNWKLSHSNIC